MFSIQAPLYINTSAILVFHPIDHLHQVLPKEKHLKYRNKSAKIFPHRAKNQSAENTKEPGFEEHSYVSLYFKVRAGTYPPTTAGLVSKG